MSGLALAGTIAVTAIISSDVQAQPQKKQTEHTSQSDGHSAKNVILLIGDGMGANQVSAAAYYNGKGFQAGKLEMDRFNNVGFARTHSHDNVVTDSAAAATAFSANKKTDNNVIGMAPKDDEHKEGEAFFDVETVLEEAAEQKKATGLVSTARITHATPAAFASHIDHRDKENEIASQMLIEHDIDVLLGGGKRYFVSKKDGGKREDGKNLIQEAKKKGYDVVENEKALGNAEGKKLLGLFNNSHMTYELDRDLTKEPSLNEMTEKALDVMGNQKEGFFLMVEGGRIDHAGHANYPAANVHETLAFDEAVGTALDFAENHKDTLVIVSADHETGGMSIGADGTYGFNRDTLKNMKRSSEYIASQLNKKRSNIKAVMEKFAGINDLNESEMKLIQHAEKADSAIAKVVSDRALIGWTTTGHTAVHVPVYAYGPQSERLSGTIDNTEIAEVISDAMDAE